MAYDDIVEALANRRVVLFAGAGIVRDADLPDWTGLGMALKDELLKQSRLPSEYVSLIDLLLKKQQVQKAMELMLFDVPRKDIVQILRGILKPSKGSEVCNLIAQMKLPGVVTTNYDRVIDACLPTNSYRLNNSLEKLALVPTAVASHYTFLLKLHGDIDDELGPDDPLVAQGAGFMVLSTADYASLMQGQRRTYLSLALHSILSQYSVLFVGYSFSDPDIDWILRFLTECCRFSNTAWYVGLKGERLPSLPQNVTGIEPLDNWADLHKWLGELSEAARKSGVSKGKVKQMQLIAQPLSDEKRQSYVAVSQYLMDLEYAGLAESVLAAALLGKISVTAEFDLTWLAGEIAEFTEVGSSLAKALASATVRYLADLKLVKVRADGRFETAGDAVSTLQSRTSAEWEKDKSRFYASISQRLGSGTDSNRDKFNEGLDAILQSLCINFGQDMAEWVHRGIGRELGWQLTRELVESHFKDKEDVRKAKAVFEMLFAQPYDAEIPYLYRLLGAAFLSNSVRLDPFASKAVRTTLSSYELFLDSNILLPLLIKEHEDYATMRAIIEESRKVGVRLLALECFFDEMCGHLDVAMRTVDECEGDLPALSELVVVWGKHANCFIQGYVNTLDPSELEGGGDASSASVKWADYCQRYTPEHLKEEMKKVGVSVIPLTSDKEPTNSAEYGQVLSLVTAAWNRRSNSRYPRPPVLNRNEAQQFCHVYRRRREMKASGLAPEVWFLSFETVLANVFAQNASKWELPPTFPFSAWVAFLDSRLPWAPKNPAAIVNAILKGNSEAFNLPDPVALVRRKAFGYRVPTKVEEEALQFQLTSFSLIKRVEQARSAVLRRGNLKETTRESREAIKQATGEIAKDLGETIRRLEEQLAKQKKEIMNVKAKSAGHERKTDVLDEKGRRSEPTEPKRKNTVPSRPKKRHGF